MSQFYLLLGGAAPWGDYGDILRNGLLTPLPEGGRGVIEVERTGPFVPPITFPFGAILVTEATKEKIDGGSFSGMGFKRARYNKVVRLGWHEWDPHAPEPERYPAGGEPENYILGRKHDERIAAQMPSLWAFEVPSTPGLQVIPGNTFRRDRAPNADIFREYAYCWISERMKLWFEAHLGDWVRCQPVEPA